jgi:hypothetical protein
VVLGAGVAGLEAAFMLEARLSGRVDLQVVSEGDEFVLRPNLVYVPFGADPAMSRLWVAEALARKAIVFQQGRVDGVDADLGRVHLTDGRELPYEHLIVATGSTPWMHAVPGLGEHAAGIWGPAEMLALRERFTHLRGRAREDARQRVLFVVARHNRSSSPLYEVALMLDTWLRREGVREQVDLVFSTPEASFVEAAGARMHEIIDGEFAERGIDGRPSERLRELRAPRRPSPGATSSGSTCS